MATPSNQPHVPDYTLLHRIGEGAYGEVWLCQDVHRQYRAAKIIYRDRFDHDRPFEREQEGIRSFASMPADESQLRIFHVGPKSPTTYFYYVMELADDVSAGIEHEPSQYLPRTLAYELRKQGRFPFSECLEAGLKLVSALTFLHRHNLIHRDIKPDNIIYVDGQLKLGDLGLVIETDAVTSDLGTLGYIPPEGSGSKQADIFAVGKILYQMATGKAPAEYPDPATELNGRQEWRDQEELNQIIFRACDRNPNKRYSNAQDMRSDLLTLTLGRSLTNARRMERSLRWAKRLGLSLGLLLIAALAWAGLQQILRVASTRSQIRVLQSAAAQRETAGDGIRALSQWAEVLALEPDAAAKASARFRLAMTLKHSPRLIHQWNHQDSVNALSFSPDGSILAVATEDGGLTLWRVDSRTNRIYSVQAATGGGVEQLAFSKAGDLLATAGLDRFARVWPLQPGTSFPNMEFQHPGAVYDVDFSIDGLTLLTACADGMLRLWNVTDGTIAREWPYPSEGGFPRSACFSPRGDQIVAAGQSLGGCSAYIWEIDGPQLRQRPFQMTHAAAKNNWIYATGFSPDGERIVTASLDRTAAIWSAADGSRLHTLYHDRGVHSAEFAAGGHFVISSSWDANVRIWDARTGRRAHSIIPLPDNPNCGTLAPNAPLLACGHSSGAVSLWALPTDPALALRSFARGILPPQDDINQLFTTNNATLLNTNSVILASETQLVQITPLDDGPRQVTVLGLGPSESPSPGWTLTTPTAQADLSPRDNLLLTTAPGATHLWDLHTGRLVAAIPSSPETYRGFFSPRGTHILTVSPTNASVWRAQDQRFEFAFPHHFTTEDQLPPVFSQDESKVLAWDGPEVRVFNCENGALLAGPLPHEKPVGVAAFSASGRWVASGCKDSSVGGSYAQIWSLPDGKPAGPQLRHRDGILAIVFSPAETSILTTDEDGDAWIWDLPQGTLRHRLPHGARVYGANYNADGTRIVTACEDRTIRIWDTKSGLPLTPPLRNDWPVTSAAFVLDDSAILAQRQNGQSRLWDLSFPASDEALIRMCRAQNPDMSLGGPQLGVGAIPDDLIRDYPWVYSLDQSEILSWRVRFPRAPLSSVP